jgi:integrase
MGEGRSVLEKFRIPTEKNPKCPLFDEDTIRALLAIALAVHPFLRPLIIVAWRAGRRLSSILALRWDDINFEQGTIRWRGEQTRSVRRGSCPPTRSS